MHAISTRRIPRLAAGVVIAVLALGADPTFAKKDDGGADEKLQALTVELKKIDVEDERKAATAEIGQAEALRDKARSIIGERKQREVLQRTMEELEATIALASAKIVESQRQAELDDELKKLAEARTQLQQSRAEVARLEDEQTKIEKQLGGKK